MTREDWYWKTLSVNLWIIEHFFIFEIDVRSQEENDLPRKRFSFNYFSKIYIDSALWLVMVKRFSTRTSTTIIWANISLRFQVFPSFIHYIDVIMGTMASQITSLTIVYSTVYSGEDQRKHQSSASLAFVMGIHLWPMNSPHKGPVTRNMFPFDDVIMLIDAVKYVTESHLITRWSEISFHHHDNWGLKMVDILRMFSNPFSWTQMLAFKLYWICFLQSKCQ